MPKDPTPFSVAYYVKMTVCHVWLCCSHVSFFFPYCISFSVKFLKAFFPCLYLLKTIVKLIALPDFKCYHAGLPVVLKFLKCHRCPEIVLKSAIVLKFYSFGQNILIWTFVMLSLRHCIHFSTFVYKSWLCLCCWRRVSSYVFSCDILLFYVNRALVTFLGLQYWSASMNNIYEDRKTCIFCVVSLVKPTKMSWNFVNIGSWNFTSCSWEPWV